MDNSVQSLAGLFKVPPERLIEMLHDAGVSDKTVDDAISFAEKQLLINRLKTGEFTINQPAQERELEVQDSTGRKKTITIKHKPSPRRVISRFEDERRKLEQSEVLEGVRAAEAEALESAASESLEVDADDEAVQVVEQEIEATPDGGAHAEHQEAKVQQEPAEAEQAQQEQVEAAAEPERPTQPAATEAKDSKRKEADADDGKRRSRSKRKAGRKTDEVREKLDVKNKRKQKRRRRLQAETVKAAERHGFTKPTEQVVHQVPISESNKVSELAAAMSIKAADLIAVLMNSGVIANINDTIDADEATLAVVELGHTPYEVESRDVEESILRIDDDNRERLPRAPVVAVMGHVDHGKTTLLDHIRRTRVAEGEKGGITQRIGAYQVETEQGQITFLDTPGHEAFGSMRRRGAKVADIVILVVAGDDGVKPQTIEAISHAKLADVPMIVAVNKMDKGKASADRVCNELTAHGVVVEDLGGQVQAIEISALKGNGVDKLLEAVMTEAEVQDLTAPVDGHAQGIVIESKKDTGRGPVASVLIQSGTVRVGDIVVSGVVRGRARTLTDDRLQSTKAAGPSMPVEIVGLDDVPVIGDAFICVADDKTAQKLVEVRKEQQTGSGGAGPNLMFGENKSQDLNLVIKTDVLGSAEALSASIAALSTEDVKIKVVHSMVGSINETDINFASIAKASIIAFNVKVDSAARKLIDQQNIPIYEYNVIYDALDEIRKIVEGIAGPKVTEESVGMVEVREVYKFPKIGTIGGCYVSDGAVRIGLQVRVLRDEQVIHDGTINSLKRFTSDVPEVKAGQECGIGIKGCNDLKQLDQLHVYQTIES